MRFGGHNNTHHIHDEHETLILENFLLNDCGLLPFLFELENAYAAT